MDNLTVTIGPIEDTRTCEGSIFYIVTAFINGEELPDVLDVDEFFKSLCLLDNLAAAPMRITKSRITRNRREVMPTTKRLPIFNCPCGTFGCGGYYVDVEATPEILIWESKFVHSSQHGKTLRRRFVFSWENVWEIAGELIAAIYNAIPHSENGEVSYTVTGLDMVERLPFYLQRYEALGAAVVGGLEVGQKYKSS